MEDDRGGKEQIMSRWIRRFHRCVSVAFTLTVIASFVAIETGHGTPSSWITYAPLLPLAILLVVGLWLFAFFQAHRTHPTLSAVRKTG